jgi:signal transduction histidine kinase
VPLSTAARILFSRRRIAERAIIALALMLHHASAFGSFSLDRRLRQEESRSQLCSKLAPRLGATKDSHESSRRAPRMRGTKDLHESSSQPSVQQYRPFPVMPSQLFQQLALSQLELLASSLPLAGRPGISKIKSMCLYLPQENVNTGQLEFLPAVLYPHPTSERVFIASEADSGVAPTLPKTLTKLPGFAHATSLLPGYPMLSSSNERMAGIGAVEEVLCDIKAGSGAAALSVPLFAGSQTVGVLLVSPAGAPKKNGSVWAKEDREQVARAAQSLSLALSMDSERAALQMQSEVVRDALADSLHQVKNPLQALRTYGKLLQRRIADVTHEDVGKGMPPQLLELVEHLMVQSDRLVDRLKPVDSIVDSLESNGLLSLKPLGSSADQQALVRWQKAPFLPWEKEILEYARDTPSGGFDVSENTTMRSREITTKPSLPPAGGAEQRYRNKKPEPTLPARENGQKTHQTSPASSYLMEDMELEMAFVNDVLEPILSAFRAIALDRDISFFVDDSDELPGVTICPQALQEAVSNVLDNSFKYVVLPKPGSVFSRNPSPQVRVRLSPNSGSRLAPGVTILVEDNGPGILQEDRMAIFDRGFRASATRSVAGTGIGLDIALSLMQKMGGTLQISDDECQLNGTVMKFVLFRNP